MLCFLVLLVFLSFSLFLSFLRVSTIQVDPKKKLPRIPFEDDYSKSGTSLKSSPIYQHILKIFTSPVLKLSHDFYLIFPQFWSLIIKKLLKRLINLKFYKLLWHHRILALKFMEYFLKFFFFFSKQCSKLGNISQKEIQQFFFWTATEEAAFLEIKIDTTQSSSA